MIFNARRFVDASTSGASLPDFSEKPPAKDELTTDWDITQIQAVITIQESQRVEQMRIMMGG